MKSNSFSFLITAFVKTIILLLCLEIVSTAILPAIGLESVRLGFHILIILFLAFKLDSPWLPILVLILQFAHSIFSIEGWPTGTLVGITIAVTVRYVREMLEFGTAISTMIVVQIFQLIWFVLTAFILSLKLSTFDNFLGILWNFIPESILISLISPYFFRFLDHIWKINSRTGGVGI